LKANGIKSIRPNSLVAFLRILNATDSDILDYYKNIKSILRPNEQLYSKFLLNSGLRVSEAIHSYNLIIELASKGKLNEYYKEDWNCLMHFKHKMFIRGNKNCYLTFITKDLLEQIANSQQVTYYAIHKRLSLKHQPMRLDEYRDHFGTHMINNSILEAEQNLLCGRINSSVFIRFYWSPRLQELRDRVFKALETIEQQP
jgi:intergrase/recombinase